jgi:hypothetical protein
MSEKTDNSKNSSNRIEIQNFLLAGGTLSSTSSFTKQHMVATLVTT